MSRRVFISYSRSDRRLARQLVGHLKAAGHLVWIDEAGIDAGEVWAQEIVEAIRTSHVFVLLATTASVRSADVKKEVGVAGKYRIPIVPAVIPPVRIPAAIEYHISGQHQVTIDPDHASTGFAALAAQLDDIRPARPPTSGWVPGLVMLTLLILVAGGIWTVAAGVFPPWAGRPRCNAVTAAVTSVEPSRFAVFESGATLDLVVANGTTRTVHIPAAREAQARGAAGTQYVASNSLADRSWSAGVDIQPASSIPLQLGLTGSSGGTDTVTVVIPGVNESALPFLKCRLVLAPVEVAFAAE